MKLKNFMVITTSITRGELKTDANSAFPTKQEAISHAADIKDKTAAKMGKESLIISEADGGWMITNAGNIVQISIRPIEMTVNLSGYYRAVAWPESQDLMEAEGFEENSLLINNEDGLEEYGPASYFVDAEWLSQANDWND